MTSTIRCARSVPSMRKIASVLAFCSLAFQVTPAAAQLSDLGWESYGDGIGTRVQIPFGIFSVTAETGADRDSQVFRTPDGRAQVHVFAIPNQYTESPARHLQRTFPADRSILTYDRVAPHFFAISARRNGQILYRRCNFSPNEGGTIHCIELRYPEAEKRAWDSIVTRISRSLRPLYS
jgi:hypothetical protein